MSIHRHIKQDAKAATILPQHSQHSIPASRPAGAGQGSERSARAASQTARMRLAIVPDGIPESLADRPVALSRQKNRRAPPGIPTAQPAPPGRQTPRPAPRSSPPRLLPDLPRRFLARAGREPVKANPSGQLGDPGAQSSIVPQRAEPVVDTHEHLLKYVLGIVLAEPKTAHGNRIDIAREPLDELIPRLRLARAAAMDKLASLSSAAIASESTPSIRRAAAANRSRPLATALEHGRLRAKYV